MKNRIILLLIYRYLFYLIFRLPETKLILYLFKFALAVNVSVCVGVCPRKTINLRIIRILYIFKIYVTFLIG